MFVAILIALMLAVACLAAIAWRRQLVLALPFFVTLNGVPITVGGSSFRLDQLVACALGVAIVASFLIGERRPIIDSSTVYLGLILAANVVATMLNSPARAYSLVQCVNQASAWLIYAVVINLVDSREMLQRILKNGLWAAMIASSIGICAYLLAVNGVPVGGAEVSGAAATRLTMAYGAYGTMIEPNLFGSFNAVHLVLASALLATPGAPTASPFSRRMLRAMIVLAACGLLLSFTRAAWIAALAGLLCVRAMTPRIRTLRIRPGAVLWPILSLAALITVLMILPGNAGTLFRFKVFNLLNIGSQTAVLRLVTFVVALQQTAAHPVIGWGTFTFAPLVAEGSDFQQFENWRSLWIGNYLLLALHDTGILGLGLWFGLLWSTVRRPSRIIRALRESDTASAFSVAGLAAAVVTLLVAFLSTSGFSLGFPWLLLGLLGAYCRILAEPAHATSAQTLPTLSQSPTGAI